ncbi:MAG TPA: response regulator, partial [Novosphingobium sp.]|nr:response regulator [Novosphingobium sp.]
NLYEHGLSQAGYRVVRAEGGEKAEKLLASQGFALVVTDLRMPAGDGFSVIRALAELPSERRPPVVVVTGRSLSAHEQLILGDRTRAIIAKSGLSPRALVAQVSHILDEAA